MDDELEMLEFQYPSIFPVGTYVQVVQILDHPARPAMTKVKKGQTGIVHSHRTRQGQRFHRVALDNGNQYDLLMAELQRYD